MQTTGGAGQKRGKDPQSFHDRPWPDRRLAWPFLCGERLIRLVETLDVYSTKRGKQTIELAATLPSCEDQEADWLIPAVFLEKRPVAPDLEVRDAAGAMVAVPTKHECQELTLSALEHLHEDGRYDLDADPDLRLLIKDLVCRRPLVALAARVLIDEQMPELPDLLARLLDQLTDQFLLWIPVRGEAGSTHHFTITRRQHREVNPMIPRKQVIETVDLDLELGPYTLQGPFERGHRTFDPVEGLERLLRILGLAPISFERDLREACRADSYHSIIRAPEDFVVRDVRLAKMRPDPADPEEIHLEELKHEPNQTIQGHDSEMAHVNCVRRTDRAPLLLDVLLGVRNGLTTLWTLGVVITTVLLRIFEHDPKPATAQGHLEVAAAVLLLGPALAAAWAVRSDEGDLLRNVLSGTRQLLMGSAILSVAAALALIGYTPFDWDARQTLEWYAAASYVIVVVVGISWSITRQAPWVLYRHLLHTPRRNLWATALTTFVAAAIAIHPGVPHVVVGVVLLLAGLVLAITSANRVGTKMGENRRVFAPFAGVGATIAFLAAGAFLDYYDNVLDFSIVRPLTFGTELAVLLLAVGAMRK
jgi:hypothetical protein